MFSGLGARIWDAITLRGGIEGLEDEIAIPAGHDPGATREAIDTYLTSLIDMGLLLTSPGSQQPCRRRWWRR
ncbi:hypothetical protein AB0A98_22575 [Streptomyces chrestomyceticus]|uniref:hypothetical protein n=1 Tax=Streptomyces chrestomyceticus TaxID=68185 RepID=UPI0033C3D0B8